MKLRPIAKYTLVSIIIVLIAILWSYYAPDKSVEELKPIYANKGSKFIEVDNVSVHYRIKGSGPTLVLLHGTASSLHTWESWVEVLSRDFKVVTLDLPAFGLTGPNPKADYSIDYYLTFLDTFLARLQIDQCHLAGNSLGGNIAWNYAVKFPEKVKKLVLLDASGYPTNKEMSLAFKLAKNDIGAGLMRVFMPKSLIAKSLKEVYFDDELVTKDLVKRYYDLQLREGNRQAFIDRSRTKTKSRIDELEKIHQPTLILWGKEDTWIPIANAYKFHNDLPYSTLKIYEDVGHLPMEEVSQQSAEDTKAFLLAQ